MHLFHHRPTSVGIYACFLFFWTEYTHAMFLYLTVFTLLMCVVLCVQSVLAKVLPRCSAKFAQERKQRSTNQARSNARGHLPPTQALAQHISLHLYFRHTTDNGRKEILFFFFLNKSLYTLDIVTCMFLS